MSSKLAHSRSSGRSRASIASVLAVLVAAAAVLVAAAPAGARTYAVSGKQVAVDEAAGKYKMRGGLVGKWRMTSFNELATDPYYEGEGTETFKGCLDRARDRKCKGDPRGTLDFTFLYWGLFRPDDSLVWGSCWHPIVGGTGDFAGARGVLTFVDTPVGKGVKTAYVGNVSVGNNRSARAGGALPGAGCGGS